MKKCPICKTNLIKHDQIQYKSLDVKRCVIIGIKKVLVCPNHWDYDFTWVEGGYCSTCDDWFPPDIVRDFLDENE